MLSDNHSIFRFLPFEAQYQFWEVVVLFLKCICLKFWNAFLLICNKAGALGWAAITLYSGLLLPKPNLNFEISLSSSWNVFLWILKLISLCNKAGALGWVAITQYSGLLLSKPNPLLPPSPALNWISHPPWKCIFLLLEFVATTVWQICNPQIYISPQFHSESRNPGNSALEHVGSLWWICECASLG